MPVFLPTTALLMFLIGVGYGTEKVWNGPQWTQWLLLTVWIIPLCRVRRFFPGLVIIGLAGISGYLRTTTVNRWLFQPLPEGVVTVSGTIVGAPDIRSERIMLTIKPDNPSMPRILVRTDRYPGWAYGERASFTGRLEAPEQFDEHFDYPLYLQRSGVTAIMERPRVSDRSPAPITAFGVLYQIREAIETRFNRSMPEPEASLMSGILLGSRRAIPQEVQENLRTTGTSHIVAISGSNVTIMLTVLVRILPVWRRSAQFRITLLAGTFLSAMTGATASVVRGSFVAALSSFLKAQERPAPPLTILAFSAAVLCAVNPLLLMGDPGFQLSFGAYGGLLFLGGHVTRWVEAVPGLRKVPSLLKSAFAETAAASLGTAPVSWFLFGTVNTLGLIVNPLILWMIPLAMAAGFFQLLVFALPFIEQQFALTGWLTLHAVLAVITFFA